MQLLLQYQANFLLYIGLPLFSLNYITNNFTHSSALIFLSHHANTRFTTAYKVVCTLLVSISSTLQLVAYLLLYIIITLSQKYIVSFYN